MPDLKRVVAKLEENYGAPRPLPARGPFELILWEKSGYLCTDDRRERAFRELKQRVGTTPAKILEAPLEMLTEILRAGGLYPDLRALRMKQSAELTRAEFAGELEAALKLDFRQARKAFAKFPMIGEPGAEKILLFSEAHAVLALESNGLRVVCRLGFAEEHKNYSTMYRRAQEALTPQIAGMSCAKLIAAHLLLRRHGQETCRRSDPQCERCPISADCAYPLRG